MSARARVAVRQFVLDRNPGLATHALADETPLLSERLLTSLSLLDLLLLLESLRQAPIDVRSMSPDSFRSIDAIVATYLGAED